jgi:metal-sulfur cluster biosynthetic enzyme
MGSVSESAVRELLRNVYDPEMGMNIIDLGLINEVRIDGDKVEIDFTLTSPGCPVGEDIREEILSLLRHTNASEVKATIVWDPPWTWERMSEEARLDFGYPV